MNEDEYLELQMGGDIIKPIKYHIGEWRALNSIVQYWDKDDSILDIGCGIGYGVGMMNLLGFNDVVGIDLNLNKITVGRRLGHNVYPIDLMDYSSDHKFDVIWCSHAFEHMENADYAIEKIVNLLQDNGKVYFILPYPDLHPAPAHTASEQIGLDVNDDGRTVRNWFDNYLVVRYVKYSHFREREIWLACEKR